MSRTLSHSPAIPLDQLQHLVLEDASWELYEKLLKDIGEPRVLVPGTGIAQTVHR